jgi:mannose-1-phosphate guanylyltransferase
LRRARTAFVLGAGLGTRLRPLTDRTPKPLLKLGGRPIITYAMDHLLTVGVERFVVNTHYCPEAYIEAFPGRVYRGVEIIFRHEPVLLETGGGLKNIEDLLPDEESIICYNGDIVSNLSLDTLLAAHFGTRADATLAVRTEGPTLNVDLGQRGEVCDLRYRLGNRGVRQCLFTGIYIVEKRLLQFMEPGKAESIVEVFLKRIAEAPGSIRGIIINDGQWHDIGSVDVYRRLDAAMRGVVQPA